MTVKTLDIACMAGLLALALGGGFSAALSAGSGAKRLERQNAAVDARQAELQQAQSVLSSLDRALRSNQAALDVLSERLPESRGMGEFLSGLDTVARRHTVELSQVTPGVAATEELCSRTPVQFQCRGAFGSLHAVLYDLETMPRLVRIDRVGIRRGSLDTPCSMEVACSVYSR